MAFDDDYKYETHLHTNETSACAVSSGREMVRAYDDAEEKISDDLHKSIDRR